ncbi:hypothetical protein ANN_24714 [Periplaneta americana]|uniref:Uncharacterized protein n=1 Tax=Periplaneta americana TaxID=6978 RepID=A0ABQ8RZN5_PERAM|nr:hypothetical protein ANN_24714 [Periplaneta americana]
MNLSFHHPKKDQCSLCATYCDADDVKKIELQGMYDKHTEEKNAVRNKKNDAKMAAKENPIEFASAVFDLQQVIQLPISKESAVFYRRRLSVYNFTVYNIANKDCHCFLWNETISKRVSSEIATCVGIYLQELDAKGVKNVRLFADGCSGQNKNTIVVNMLSNSKNLLSINLCFFEPNHGQNEGNSAHSTISTALAQAGDIFIPCQLVPIVRLARRAAPYEVLSMRVKDFFDYKSISDSLRI